MKKLINLAFISIFILLTGCDSSSSWENVKTAGRYIQKSIDSLWGKDYNSYWVQNEEDFIGPDEDEFIPLSDTDLTKGFGTLDKAIAQPKDPLGEGGLPGFSNFKTPSTLDNIFRNMHFQTDDHVLREHPDLLTVQKIANYLKRHSKTYVCVEGHCDERASAAYNMALGTRRANHIRVLLIKQGIDFNRIYTISYGKEKPIALGHISEDWKKNRRAEFKIYEKNN